jgi:hypothetical protein
MGVEEGNIDAETHRLAVYLRIVPQVKYLHGNDLSYCAARPLICFERGNIAIIGAGPLPGVAAT